MTTREETAATVAVGTDVAALVAGLVTVAAWGSAFVGIWLAVYSVELNEAERRVDAGTAAMLVDTGAILIAIFPGMFLHEGFPPARRRGRRRPSRRRPSPRSLHAWSFTTERVRGRPS
jgi:uncharacterized membrane protein